MKIVTLNWGGKGTGSIDNIRKSIEDGLCDKDFEFYHIYESGVKSDKNYYRLSGWLTTRIYYVWAHLIGRQYGAGYIPYLKFARKVKSISPDIVHIHCPNGFAINLYAVLRFLSRKNITVIITNHAEFFYTGGCAYAKDCLEFEKGCIRCKDYKKQCNSWVVNQTQRNWKNMYDGLHSIDRLMMVAVSPWVENRMEQSRIAKDLPKCTIINGIDTEVFKYKIENENKVQLLENILANCKVKQKISKEKKIFLHVTSYFSDQKADLKGGWYVIQLARRLQDLDVLFLVAGNTNISNINDLPDNIALLGPISNQDLLADLYNIAEVNIITSQRETFGMTCAESLCCGTPVIGFKNGGSDSIALKQGAVFVDYGQIDLMEQRLRDTKSTSNSERKALSKLAHATYSKDVMSQKYGALYKQMKGRS